MRFRDDRRLGGDAALGFVFGFDLAALGFGFDLAALGFGFGFGFATFAGWRRRRREGDAGLTPDSESVVPVLSSAAAASARRRCARVRAPPLSSPP